MKVLMLNTFDEVGGAARAAVRLLRGVQGLGIDAGLLVQFKFGNASEVICNQNPLRRLARRLKGFLGTLPVRLYPNRPENNFSPALLPDHLPAEIVAIDPDIVHLHWLCAGFFQVETLRKLNKPLLWTLHDSWAFTGGCHVPYDCKRYRQSCGKCPVLGSSRERDLSRWTWNRKAKAWRDIDLTVVAPSRWLADCARSSSLFRDVRVEVIPNGLDTETFRPGDREAARDLLGLPQDKKIILFGAVRAISDPNKGLHLLASALQTFSKGGSDTLAVVFSSLDDSAMPDLGMPAVFLGRVHDDRKLAAIYTAADVFVAPSVQEAFCQTASEALACGTPVVAFGATGLLDVVEHQKCGYLAQPYDAVDLGRGIAWVLEDMDRHSQLSFRARQKAKTEFCLDKVSGRYVTMYRQLLAQRQGAGISGNEDLA
jgi:glycosyltransferase involved in cell wall biosynthesis